MYNLQMRSVKLSVMSVMIERCQYLVIILMEHIESE